VENCWAFKNGAQHIIEISWSPKNKSPLNIVFHSLQCRSRLHVVGIFLRKNTIKSITLNQHPFPQRDLNLQKSSGFGPTPQKLRKPGLEDEYFVTELWYRTVICRELKFMIRFIQLITNSQPKLEVSTCDVWKPYCVESPLKMPYDRKSFCYV
jgi:hypothetical protein